MGRKSLPLFVFLGVLVAYEAAAAATGGWTPIGNPKDPEVVKIGEFAVTQHNKEAKTNLKFVSVVSGETQVVSGTNYRLVISATDGGGGAAKNYRVVVWSKPWQKFLKLQSFEDA